MKVAFTTSTGVEIDENFRKTKTFTVWDIGPNEACYVNTIAIDCDEDNEEDRITARVNSLIECSLVCTRQINGPATAKLVARNIHTLKTIENTPVEEIIGKLQSVLRRTNPPPWMRKAMQRGYSGGVQDGSGRCRLKEIWAPHLPHPPLMVILGVY